MIDLIKFVGVLNSINWANPFIVATKFSAAIYTACTVLLSLDIYSDKTDCHFPNINKTTVDRYCMLPGNLFIDSTDSDERIDQSHYNWFRARLMFMAITSMIPYVFWHGFGGKPFEKLWRMLFQVHEVPISAESTGKELSANMKMGCINISFYKYFVGYCWASVAVSIAMFINGIFWMAIFGHNHQVFFKYGLMKGLDVVFPDMAKCKLHDIQHIPIVDCYLYSNAFNREIFLLVSVVFAYQIGCAIINQLFCLLFVSVKSFRHLILVLLAHGSPDIAKNKSAEKLSESFVLILISGKVSSSTFIETLKNLE